ncbi:hypothetical protein IFM89_034203 [Coptis chinensis]|uniref:Uncharacterized protein n=1 Tax=Coptis chinensis TaxID=261450 RepID=A0A835LDD0_9MAGN|nr:hypothetical protein IFM89_034203 [Coptis chinensis]
MDVIDHTKSSTTKDDEVEPVELLDDYWFFQNLLYKKDRMFRSSSDPYPSSNSMEEVFVQIKDKGSSDSSHHLKENTLVRQNLLRTPSLPLSIGREKDVEEKETVSRSNKLIRQSSLCSSNVLPPLRASKSTSPSPEIPKHQARRKPVVASTIQNSKPRPYRNKDMQRSLSQRISKSPSEVDTEEAQGSKDLGTFKQEGKPRPYLTKEMLHRSLSQNKNSKSPSELEIEEVQGFKDLGFDFDKIDINPSVVDIIPGLQSKKPDNWNEDMVRRPYLSEAWLVQRSTPVMPDWIDHGSVGDMKKQLKYWARAVASNMRQEC